MFILTTLALSMAIAGTGDAVLATIVMPAVVCSALFSEFYWGVRGELVYRSRVRGRTVRKCPKAGGCAVAQTGVDCMKCHLKWS